MEIMEKQFSNLFRSILIIVIIITSIHSFYLFILRIKSSIILIITSKFQQKMKK